MNQIAVFNPAKPPAFARKGELSDVAKALVGSGAGGKRISIKGGVFRLIADGKEVSRIDERFLDVVICAAAPKVARTFYARVYDENDMSGPDCWSANGDTPDAACKKPQSKACATCPQNIKGSGQGDSRACRYSQRLAVVLADDVEGDVMQLNLPAMSLFGKATGDCRPLQDYARYLVAQGVDPTMLVTRMKFDTTAAVPKLLFKPERWLTDEEYSITSEKAKTPEALSAITFTVFQQDSTHAAAPALPGTPPRTAAPTPTPVEEVDDAPAPAPAPAPRKPRAAKPAPAPVEDEVVAEPVVQKATKPAPVAPSTSLAAVLSDWDDE